MATREIEQLEGIKRLLILLLIKLGSPSEEIGAALSVDSSVVRRLVPTRKVRRLSFPGVTPE